MSGTDDRIGLAEALRAVRSTAPLMFTHARPLVLSILAITLARLCTLAVAVVGAWLVGATLVGDRPEPILAWAAALCAGAVAAGVASWFGNWWSHVYAFRIIAEIRVQVFRALERAAPFSPRGRPSAEAATVVMSEAERLEWLYAHIVPLGIATIVVATSGIVALGLVHPLFALIALLAIALLVLVPLVAAPLARSQGHSLRRRMAQLHVVVTDGLQGLSDLVASGGLPGYQRRLRRSERDLLGTKLRMGRRSGVESAANDLGQAGGVVLVVAIAAALLTAGAIAPASLPAVIVLTGGVLGTVAAFVSNTLELGEVLGCMVRVVRILDAPPRVAAPTHPARVEAGDDAWIRFEGVAFSYADPEAVGAADRVPPPPRVLDDVTFEVRRGRTTALVGTSGAGKSTCTSLMLRFDDPMSGRVLLHGTDVRRIGLRELRRRVGVVAQETFLLHGTIRENVRLSTPDASDDEVWAALRDAQAATFVRLLPAGLDTVLDENGASLSGGERQRLAIARVLLAEPDVLVLDEAATGIDTGAEARLREALDRGAARRATLVIAHRRESVLAADHVVVLDDGRIVESGPPAALIARGGRLGTLLATDDADAPDRSAEADGAHRDPTHETENHR